MDTPAWLSEAWSIFLNITARVWNFIKNRPAHIAIAVLVVLVINIAMGYVSASAEKQILIYVGSAGASSNRMQDRIAKSVRGISDVPGFEYQAAVVTTTGTPDIDRQIADDPDGRSIGVSVDRTNHLKGLRTLLPMDWQYLHIFARVAFLQSLRPDKDLPTEFSQVAERLAYGKVYADSESFELASVLFDKYKHRSDDSIYDVLAPWLTDWKQAAAALKAGQIDVAFYSGPLGATTVQEIADDGKTVLLGLDGLTSTLSQNPDLKLIAVNIPRYFYRASQLEVSGRDGTALYFCSRDVPTLAARRLIVASRRMSDRDAYLISDALTATLGEEEDIPSNTWQRSSPQSDAGKDNVQLGIAPHPGAVMCRDGVTLTSLWKPWTWTAAVSSILIGLASIVATSSLAWVNRRLKRSLKLPAAAPSGSDTPSSKFELMKAEIDSLVNQLERTPEPISREQYETWASRIQQLRSTIRVDQHDQKISTDNATVLFAAVRSLDRELSSVSVSPSTQTKVEASSVNGA